MRKKVRKSISNYTFNDDFIVSSRLTRLLDVSFRLFTSHSRQLICDPIRNGTFYVYHRTCSCTFVQTSYVVRHVVNSRLYCFKSNVCFSMHLFLRVINYIMFTLHSLPFVALCTTLLPFLSFHYITLRVFQFAYFFHYEQLCVGDVMQPVLVVCVCVPASLTKLQVEKIYRSRSRGCKSNHDVTTWWADSPIGVD